MQHLLAFALAVGLSLTACGNKEEDRLAQLQSKCSSLDTNYNEKNIEGCTAFLALPNLSPTVRAMTLNVRGNTYDALGKHDLAIADYTEVTLLLPDFAPAYANLALQHARKSDFKTALNFYEQALKLNPKSSYAMYGRGVALGRLGQLDAAREQLGTANAADPEMAGVYRQIKMEPSL